jgi:tetratricopeptide (TPR) repeat protein
MYLLGLLSAELGDFSAARVYADRLEALGPLEATPTLHQDLALAVRADVLMRENRFEDALTMLDQAPWRVNNKISWGLPGEREKFLRAQALQGLGRYDEALRLYRPRGDRILAPVLLAPSHYYRGQIYQELGDTEKALWHYGAFVELWKDADPEYRPIVQEVLGRMARLAGEG